MKNGGYLKRRTPLKPSYKARIKSIKTRIDGILFDSKWEAECYSWLKIRQAAKEISHIETHVMIPIIVHRKDGTPRQFNHIQVDFKFYDIKRKTWVLADAKPPERLDHERKEWFFKWYLIQFLYPENRYELYRKHEMDSWRAYKPEREKAA